MINLRESLNKKLVITILLASLVLSLTISKAFFSHDSEVKLVEGEINWQETHTPWRTAYFRKKINITASVQHAWFMMGARDSFELLVNGNTVGRFFHWRPTRPFQNGLSESGQKLVKTQPALSLNYPREYQWSAHKSYKLPVYFDLQPYLKKGENIVAIKVESRKTNASFYSRGLIGMSTGQSISLLSDDTWLATTLPLKDGRNHWSEIGFNDESWQKSQASKISDQSVYNSFNPSVFSKNFEGQLLTKGSDVEVDAHWFSSNWILESTPEDAWIRIYANRKYTAFINGKVLKIPSKRNNSSDSGEWIAQTKRGQDLPANPELLDPDEIGDYFSGSKFQNAPHSDPTINNFKMFNNEQNRTKESPFASLDTPENSGSTGRSIDASAFDPRSYRPERPTPKNLTRSLSDESFYMYSIKWLLKKGNNSISIRVNNPKLASGLPSVAIDGLAHLKNNQVSPLKSDKTWTSMGQTIDGTFNASLVVKHSEKLGFKRPKMEYRGRVYSMGHKLKDLFIVYGLFVSLLSLLSALTLKDERLEVKREAIVYALFMASLIGLSAFILESSFWERHEVIYFKKQSTWLFVVFLQMLFATLVFNRITGKKNFVSNLYQSTHRNLLKQSQSNTWSILVTLILALGFVLRVYRLSEQPLDDDEYASTQASIAIANTGVPQFDGDIWYTRSPLYHYLVGSMIKIFGYGPLALKLPSIFFSILTAYLVYRIGKEVCHSKGIGLAAMVLYTFHPFAIYSAHIARFYQQQQFFYLLTVYLFIRGFVLGKNQTLAFATLFSFLFAFLSQEISIILGFQLVLAYLCFAKKRSSYDNSQLVTVAISVILIAVINLFIFQTKCLTRLEGVSPNLEATLGLNFNNPMNFFSMLIGYSRLHVPLSFFFLLGLPFCLRKNNSNIFVLYFFTLSGIFFSNVLITGVSFRYQYGLIPLWLILSVYGSWSLIELATEKIRTAQEKRHLWLAPFSFSIFFLTFFLSFSPWRIIDSYDAKILGDSTGALQYVQQRIKAGDKVAITEPHPHAAKVELGKVDYDLAIPLLYDYAYLKNGVLVDRNGGAEVLSGVNDLQKVIANNDRVWVLVNREKFRSRGKNIRWEYPGARAELFLRENLTIVHETYLWTVFLWDKESGAYRSFRTHG